MSPRSYRLYVVALLLLVTALLGGEACQQTDQGTDTALVLGLDHIPLAVADLDEAAKTFRELGLRSNLSLQMRRATPSRLSTSGTLPRVMARRL